MKSILLLIFSVSLTIFSFPSALAEGGGGIDCPETLGPYSYVEGSVNYEILATDVDEFGLLYCEFESFEDEIIQFGSIDVMFHTSKELSHQLSDEYGCGGEKLGSEMGALYVSSTTHFAAVSFSTSDLQNIAENILSQIEQQDLATICTENSSDNSTPDIDEETQKELEEIIKEFDEPAEFVKEEEFLEDEGELSEEEILDAEELAYEAELELAFVLPDWIKNNSEWWASDQITDDDFLSGIEYLIEEGIILIPPTEVESEPSNELPRWIKFNAGWWAEGQITDSEFVDGIQYLISTGIISLE